MRQAAQNSYLVLVAFLGVVALSLTSTTALLKLLGATVLIMVGIYLAVHASEIDHLRRGVPGQGGGEFRCACGHGDSGDRNPCGSLQRGRRDYPGVVGAEHRHVDLRPVGRPGPAESGQLHQGHVVRTTTTEVGSVAPAPGDTFVVYGFSQSSTIATLEKRALAAEYAPGEGPDVSFVLIANGNRPNGGFLSRGPKASPSRGSCRSAGRRSTDHPDRTPSTTPSTSPRSTTAGRISR